MIPDNTVAPSFKGGRHGRLAVCWKETRRCMILRLICWMNRTVERPSSWSDLRRLDRRVFPMVWWLRFVFIWTDTAQTTTVMSIWNERTRNAHTIRTIGNWFCPILYREAKARNYNGSLWFCVYVVSSSVGTGTSLGELTQSNAPQRNATQRNAKSGKKGNIPLSLIKFILDQTKTKIDFFFVWYYGTASISFF